MSDKLGNGENLSEFRKKVYAAVRTIPAGKVANTYDAVHVSLYLSKTPMLDRGTYKKIK